MRFARLTDEAFNKFKECNHCEEITQEIIPVIKENEFTRGFFSENTREENLMKAADGKKLTYIVFTIESKHYCTEFMNMKNFN